MKNYIIVLLGILLFSSCDPDVPEEGITLEPLNFSFNVEKDSAIHQLGDTIKLTSSLPNKGNINDGILRLMLNIHIAEVDSISVLDPDVVKNAIEGEDYLLIKKSGDVEYNSSIEGLLRNIVIYPLISDSLKFHYEIIPLKKGVFRLSFYSSFYEGALVKARTTGNFLTHSPNWGFYKDADDLPIPGDDLYYLSFLFRID